MTDAEAAIELLKSLGAPPSGNSGDNSGIIATIDKLRVEFSEKVKHHDFNVNAKIDMNNDDVIKRIN